MDAVITVTFALNLFCWLVCVFLTNCDLIESYQSLILISAHFVILLSGIQTFLRGAPLFPHFQNLISVRTVLQSDDCLTMAERVDLHCHQGPWLSLLYLRRQGTLLLIMHFHVVENGIIKDVRVAEAMKQVDRANFCKYNAYTDSPQSIGYAVTISAPHMVSLQALVSPRKLCSTPWESWNVPDVQLLGLRRNWGDGGG